jgi:short-subunit dehydrogenase
MRLTHEFLRRLRAPGACGILNIVSSTGRCGNPLLASYSASNAALWTFSEALARELADTDIHVCTYVASAMHSPMQKRMGRLALRYFRMGGHFDFNHCEETAIEVVDVFLERRAFFIGKASRMKIFTNALWPELISQKISKMWRT